MQYKLGFIGCGNMAQAIAGGAIKQGVVAAEEIIVSAPSEANRSVFADWGCATTADNQMVAAGSEQLVLAVKPQVFPSVVSELANTISEAQVLISIMAGWRCAKIAEAIGRPCRVVRVMPNTPSLVGEGVAGVALGEDARPGDDAFTKKLFEAVGSVVPLDESLIDGISAVSGSGPAYVFYLAEAMEQAAAELGLGDQARQIVAQTLLGAGKLLLESGEDPRELRRKVTSPGGSTLAATTHMDEQQVQPAIIAGIHAAVARAKELGG